MRLFLDANVIFSAAHNPQGNARALFRLAEESRVTLIASHYAIDEAARNIALKFPDCTGEFQALVAAELVAVSEPNPTAVAAAAAAGLVAKDVPILAAAIASRADVLVTGDKRHFGPMYGNTVHSVRVVAPAEAVVLLLERIPSH